jgi:ABC-type phosphate/phosphonate transport system substrate-binding protein
MPIVSLPMYDWPEVASANDELWSLWRRALGKRGIEAPAELVRQSDYEASWSARNLLVSQTCGYPYASTLRGNVQLVGTPHYSAEGCEGPDYSSAIIARRGGSIRSLADLSGATAAINSRHSQSGHWALRSAIAETREGKLPARVILTGSHRNSIVAVAEKRADVAAIDAVCWALALAHERERTESLAVIAWSPITPCLPLITSFGSSRETVAALRSTFAEVIANPQSTRVRGKLLLSGFTALRDQAYDRILDLESRAKAFPFPL